eukprot:5517142-Pleurochrysis_carterae.AAC.1
MGNTHLRVLPLLLRPCSCASLALVASQQQTWLQQFPCGHVAARRNAKVGIEELHQARIDG